ncbi:MAG: hypothetical protein R3B96_01385 [Pirellulaceae bacterium]
MPAFDPRGSAAPAGNTPNNREPVAETVVPEEPVGESNPPATYFARDQVGRWLVLLQQQEQLSGKPLPLVDAISRASDPARRKTAGKRYWTLTATALDLVNARAEADFLAGITPPADSRQRATLEAAQAIARARRAEATLAFKMAQRGLAETLDTDVQVEAPIPVDSPFIGRYRTNYNTFAAQGSVRDDLATIDWSLPLVLETIHARSEALAALDREVREVKSRYDVGQLSVDELLRVHQDLRDQRMAFLASVRDYNLSIAEYSLSVGPASLGPTDVVSMLVVEPTASIARAPGSDSRGGSRRSLR